MTKFNHPIRMIEYSLSHFLLLLELASSGIHPVLTNYQQVAQFVFLQIVKMTRHLIGDKE